MVPQGRGCHQVKTRGAHPAGSVYFCTDTAAALRGWGMFWGHRRDPGPAQACYWGGGLTQEGQHLDKGVLGAG